MLPYFKQNFEHNNYRKEKEKLEREKSKADWSLLSTEDQLLNPLSTLKLNSRTDQLKIILEAIVCSIKVLERSLHAQYSVYYLEL